MATLHVVIHSPIMVSLHTQRRVYRMCQRLTDKSVLNTSLDMIIYESSLVKCILCFLNPMLTSKQKISSLVKAPGRKFNWRDFIARNKQQSPEGQKGASIAGEGKRRQIQGRYSSIKFQTLCRTTKQMRSLYNTTLCIMVCEFFQVSQASGQNMK